MDDTRGAEFIDHCPGAHDDLANAAAGALVVAFKEPWDESEPTEITYQPERGPDAWMGL